MKSDKFKNKAMAMDDLDAVAGGASVDRSYNMLWVESHYGNKGTHGQIVDTSSGNADTILENFCAKAGVEYEKREHGADRIKIDGQWRNAQWLRDHSSEALSFFDKQLGLS